MAGMNIFNSVKSNAVKTNMFDLSHDVKMSFEMGELVPVCAVEAVPGDRFNIGSESLVRFAPTVTPFMHNIDVKMEYFFVPNRILWSGWEDFISGSLSSPAHPYFADAEFDLGSLGDYLGLPTGVSIDKVNALPFAAYQMIYNEYYRDQNLIAPVSFKLSDGLNAGSSFDSIRRRAWEHDYFTAALPFAQKGDAVDIPLGVVSYDNPDGNNGKLIDVDGTPIGASALSVNGGGTDTSNILTTGGNNLAYDPNGSLSVEPTTINDLRLAYKVQEWLERAARAGTRYTESILSHFGVKSSDSRLQRPEFICGNRQPVVVSEVLQTSSTDETSPQANMAGHALSVGSGYGESYYCEEHGWIIGIMSVIPRTAYQQGLHKSWSRFDKFDYYFPEFAHLGEQAVLNREVYYNNDIADDDTFGYVPRYAEMRFINSRVAGQFRTTQSNWHLGRIFSSRPSLNQSFIECSPSKRIFAVTDTSVDSMWCHVFNQIKVNRKMPKFGEPGGL